MQGNHMDGTAELTYNSRLFGRGLYGSHHLARFQWLRKQLGLLGLAEASVLELGCFDAKTVDWIPFEVSRYVGQDAGWESDSDSDCPTGLAAAQARFGDDSRFRFIQSTEPLDMRELTGTFDVGICMETLEHIPPAQVDDYLAAFAAKLSGPLFVTVPNEKGTALLQKTLGGLILGHKRPIVYERGEFINSLLGRMDRVQRNQHKGFDYDKLAQALRRHFRHVAVQGPRLRWLPLSFQLTIGMVAKN
jgi:hypothetical protein